MPVELAHPDMLSDAPVERHPADGEATMPMDDSTAHRQRPRPARPVRDRQVARPHLRPHAVDPAGRAGRCGSSVWSATRRRSPGRSSRPCPASEVTADFHCVTRFSTLDNRWEGVSTREVLRPRPGRSRGLPRHGPLRRRLHHQPAARGLPLRGAPGRPPQRQAAGGRPRRPGAPHRAPPLRLEERQVGERHRAAARGPARLLGGERLPHLRRPLARGALQLAGDPGSRTR